MIAAKKILLALLALALGACGNSSEEQEALGLLAPPEDAVLGARLNPALAERLWGLKLTADSVQRIRIEDTDIRADSALRWRVLEEIPGDIYRFELTAPKQPLAFGSMIRIEVGYAGSVEFVDCHFRVADGALKLAGGETRAAERAGAWVFPCEATTRPGLSYLFVSIYPAVTYSSFLKSEKVTGALEFQTLAYRRRNQGEEESGV